MIALLFLFLVLNLSAFALIGYDKYLAKNRKRRISENTLLILVVLGGTIGSGIAMLFFRHKTSKKSYLLRFWAIALIQIVVMVLYFYFLKEVHIFENYK